MNTNHAPFGAITIHRAVTTAGNAVSGFNQWRNQRATRVALRSMSDDMLRDIGLSGVDRF